MFQIKTRKKPLLILYLTLLLSVLVSLIIDDGTNRSLYILFISTLSVFFICYSCNKITSPASLLIISSFVFLGCRPFLSLFTSFDYRNGDWFITGYLDKDVIYANYAISFMYFGYSVALILSNNNSTRRECYSLNQINPNIRFLFVLFLFGFLGQILKGLYFYSFIESNSYVGIYQDKVNLPMGYDFLSYLFYCSFFLICAFYDKLRVNKLFLLISILIAAFSAMKGSRGEFITFLLTVFCIYYNERKVSNIRLLLKMFLIFIAIFTVSEFVSMWRSGGSFIALIEGDNPLLQFIYGMGVSYIAIYQSVKITLISGVFDFHYLISQLLITISSVLGVQVYLPDISYSHLVSKTANPQLYQQGFGLGGSYLGESFLAMGLIGCFIIPFIVLFLINNLERFTKYNKTFYFLYYSSLPSVLFIPRETLLYFFPYVIKGIVVAFLFICYSNIKMRRFNNG
ncbi:O-antigen polysaccharide polymerase Wzy [Salmonella enterica subsp. arizonae serovar 40:z4,z23:-]|nr:O-antigen polysaccharide polymerase Wzy [Salmonella enterica subsp. arizonae serovar 40:z4,z23:-]